MPCVLLIAICLATSPPVATPQAAGDTITVLPGDTLVDPGRLVPHRVTWRVTRRNPEGGSTVQGLWTDTWVRSTEDGRPVVIFRQLFADTAGVVLVDNETVFDSASFRGIRSTQRLPPNGSWVTYRYAGDTASGTLRPSAAAEEREFRVVFDEPVWEPLLPVPVLVPLERWKPGTVLRYPVWNQVGPGGDVTWREMRVDSVGQVTVAGGRTIEAWHRTAITAATPNTVFRLWQTPEPPYHWWFVVERPSLTREWTLVDWEPFVPRP